MPAERTAEQPQALIAGRLGPLAQESRRFRRIGKDSHLPQVIFHAPCDVVIEANLAVSIDVGADALSFFPVYPRSDPNRLGVVTEVVVVKSECVFRHLLYLVNVFTVMPSGPMS